MKTVCCPFWSRPLLAFLALACFSAWPLHAQSTFRVYVLAGQSNMEGKAPNALFEHQATDEKTREFFAHLREGDQWKVRQDVWIKYLGRHGALTLGYGSRDRTGVEFELGSVLGDHYEEPVLLIKTAWGGHALFKQFRPPSRGLPPREALEAELEQAQKRVSQNNEKNNRQDPLPTMDEITAVYGSSYRQMLDEVRTTLQECDTLFPELRGRQPKMAGLVWFQGWNDQYGGVEQEYEANMRAFIEDVRKDLDAPGLPVVIGVMGQNGSQPAKGAMEVIQRAQLAMPEIAEFKGNVAAVRTDVLIDKAAEELYPHWRERFEEWQKVGGDRAYHYLGSAIWFTRIGRAMGEALIELDRQ